MEKHLLSFDDLIEYYKNQTFKMLGMFESKDFDGWRYALRIRSEFSQLPYQYESLYKDLKFNRVVAKMDVIIEELFYMEGDNHQFVKNHVMENIKLLDGIKGDFNADV